MTGTRRLRELLGRPGLVVAPGVYDGLSAIIAQQAGFEAVYASGGAIARSAGLPDLGLLSSTEAAGRIAEIVEAVDLPVIVDADTGYGNALNVRRTVAQLERIGVAALHLEDQITPKKCGHYNNKSLIDTAEMSAKLRAALDARTDDNLLLIARTDAIAVEGFDAAIDRAAAYAAAGADMLFVEAPQSVAQVRQIAQRLGVPLLINMFAGGKTPLMDAAQLAGLGYRVL
ncbi:MAG: isocitrate lyase/PEP mutase family protein, partial [Mycobacteriales bacterium]